MSELKFDNKFKTMIENGEKIQTIRNHLKKGLKENTITDCMFINEKGTITGLGHLKILKIESKPFKDLSSYDAIFEGYRSVDILKNGLLNYYPELEDNDNVYIIRFKKEGEFF
jgi:hypothetical protein